jgi:hypothetical protein
LPCFAVIPDTQYNIVNTGRAVFEQVTEERFDIMLSFAEKYSGHLDAEIKKLGVDIKIKMILNNGAVSKR